MNKWSSFMFSVLLSFTIFQNPKVFAVHSSQINQEIVTVDSASYAVNCARQFGGYWDDPYDRIACKDVQRNKYLCDKSTCFVGTLAPSNLATYGEHKF
ncbi:hypothetical protein DFH28DRAFT_897339 [Melampsora americana]|nr:hypothetical protein DFH28DRAFT_897339 [Melampsora americana]